MQLVVNIFVVKRIISRNSLNIGVIFSRKMRGKKEGICRVKIRMRIGEAVWQRF
jgi:hypothetical protein